VLLDRVLLFVKKNSTQEAQNTFEVTGGLVATGIHIDTGDLVVTISRGKVSFAFGGFKYDADGEDKDPGDGHPAPNLRRNSLICKIDNAWYQGGVFRGFESKTDGFLYLQTNDNWVADNSEQWHVTIAVIKDLKSLVSEGKYDEEISHLNRGDFSLGSATLLKEWKELFEKLQKTEDNKVFRNNVRSSVSDLTNELIYGAS